MQQSPEARKSTKQQRLVRAVVLPVDVAHHAVELARADRVRVAADAGGLVDGLELGFWNGEYEGC